MKKVHLSIILLIALVPLLNQKVYLVKAVAQAWILSNHNGYLDLTSIPITYHVVGEIENTGTTNLHLLNVTAIFYGESNSFIGSGSSYTLLDVLLPGKKTPFEVIFKDSNVSQIQNYTLSLQFNEYLGEKPPALQILENKTYVDEAGFQRINGTIKNLALTNATAVKVVATFYAEEGKVVGVAVSYTTPSTIASNQTAPFDLELKRKGLFFPNYILTAESFEYALVPELSPLYLYSILLISALIAVFTHQRRLN